MADDDDLLELPLTLRVSKSAFKFVAPPPATVTQRTAIQHFGIPERQYKRMVKDGLFPVKRIGRLVFASYDDVRRALTDGAKAQTQLDDAVESAQGSPEPDVPMTVEEAKHYIASARSRGEERERKNEVSRKGWELAGMYDVTHDDGTRNLKSDKRLYQLGMGLVVAASGVRSSTEGPPTGVTPGVGYYRKCTWCERPAYATKQQWIWDGGYWSGGPVCTVCARKRGDDERVVQGAEVLLSARNPRIPAEGSRRRRK